MQFVISAMLPDAVLSKDGQVVALDGWTHVNPFFWAPFLPVLHIRIIAFVHLTTTKGTSQNATAVEL